jgi:hypothetical protein
LEPTTDIVESDDAKEKRQERITTCRILHEKSIAMAGV